MIRTTIIAAALAAGVAQADYIIPFGSSEFSCQEQNKMMTGSIGVDYSSKYASRGMVLGDSSTDNSVLLGGAGRYNLNKNNAIVAGASYNWLTEKGWEHNEGGVLCDELSGVIEFAHYFSSRTVLAGGYQFVHGGLPGRTNYHTNEGATRDFPFFDSNRPEEHSLVLDFHHDFAKGLDGFFWDSRVQYSFRWVEGFWFTNTFGYKYELNDKMDIVASATWNASMNYYDSHTINSNGTQGYSLQLAAPTMVTEHLRITPHASLYLIGNGANAANDISRVRTYRDTTFVFGVSASYVF